MAKTKQKELSMLTKEEKHIHVYQSIFKCQEHNICTTLERKLVREISKDPRTTAKTQVND